MDPEKVEVVLSEHVRLCGDLHDLLVEEGKIMRNSGAPPDEAFLKKKAEYLPVLEKGLQLLQKINEAEESFPRGIGVLVEKARSEIMKLLMLDKENERLLLKVSLPPKMKEAYTKVAPGRVSKVYGQYAPKTEA